MKTAGISNPLAEIRPDSFAENWVRTLIQVNVRGGRNKPPAFMVRDAQEGVARVFSAMVRQIPRKITEAMEMPDFWASDSKKDAADLETAGIEFTIGKPAKLSAWFDANVSPKYKGLEADVRAWFKDVSFSANRNHYWQEIEMMWEQEEQSYYQRMDHSRYLHRAAAMKKEHPFRAISADLIAGNVADALRLKTASGMPEELKIAMQQLTGSNNPTGLLVRMVGAKNFMFSEKDMFVQFNHMLGRSKMSPKTVGKTRLHYDMGSDTYTLTFLTSQGNVIKEVDGLYNDQLMDIWEDYTGLYLTFQSRRATAEGAPMKRARFEKGVPADPTVNMSPEDAAIWEEMTEKYGDMLKTARGTLRWRTAPSGRGFLYDTGMDVWSVRKDRNGDWFVAVNQEDGTALRSPEFYDDVEDAKAEAERRIRAPFDNILGMRRMARKTAKFEKGVPADPTVNMTPEDAAEWERMNEEYGDLLKKTALQKAAKIVAKEPYLRALQRMTDAFSRANGNHAKLYDAISRRVEATKDRGKLLGIIDAIENDVLAGTFGAVPPHIEKRYTDLVNQVMGKTRTASLLNYVNLGEAEAAVKSVFRGAQHKYFPDRFVWLNEAESGVIGLKYLGIITTKGRVTFEVTLRSGTIHMTLLQQSDIVENEDEAGLFISQCLSALSAVKTRLKNLIANI